MNRTDTINKLSADQWEDRFDLQAQISGARVEFKPGDLSTYVFVIEESSSQPGTAVVRDEEMMERPVRVKASTIRATYDRLNGYVGRPRTEQHGALSDPVVETVSDQGQCSAWTAWALIQCVREYWQHLNN